jgi:hypothetical protein
MKKQQVIDDRKLVAKLMSGRTGQMQSYIAILLVSVGKENFEGESINAAVNMINDEFKECVIVIADTLQRYNIATEKEISLQQAYDESLVKGDEWLARHESCFKNNFKIPYKIIRWDSFITDPDFQEREKNFLSIIETNSILAQAMDKSTEEYGNRLQNRFDENHYNQIVARHKQNCFSYLKEECVAITLFPKKIGFVDKIAPSTIVYPGKSTAILTENREIFIKEQFDDMLKQYGDFLNWLPYRFNKVKDFGDIHLIQSLKRKEDGVSKIEELSRLKEMDYINNLSEVQLNSMYAVLDERFAHEFSAYTLDFLLSKDTLLKSNVEALECGQAFSIESIAYIFTNQLIAMFNTLEKKMANKCKANVIRILKRNALNFNDCNGKGENITDHVH